VLLGDFGQLPSPPSEEAVASSATSTPLGLMAKRGGCRVTSPPLVSRKHPVLPLRTSLALGPSLPAVGLAQTRRRPALTRRSLVTSRLDGRTLSPAGLAPSTLRVGRCVWRHAYRTLSRDPLGGGCLVLCLVARMLRGDAAACPVTPAPRRHSGWQGQLCSARGWSE